MKTLFERVGGRTALDTAVRSLYARMLGDPEIAPFFDGIDLERQTQKMIAFLTYVLGGASEVGTIDLRRAHTPLLARGLDDAHVDRTIAHLEASLRDAGVGDEEIDDVLAIAESTRDAVLGRGRQGR